MIGVLLLLLMVLYLDILTTSLVLLTIASMITITVYKYHVVFTKPWILYVIALLLGTTALLWHESEYVSFIVQGYVGYGFFLVVMMVGVLPNRWTISRRIKKQRGVLSILGFLLITPHAVSHVFGLLEGINLFGIAAYVLMVPLTIISFQVIKKEIQPKDWIAVQKAAYGIYIALFIHLIMVADWVDKLVYVALLVLYINNKLYKEWKR